MADTVLDALVITLGIDPSGLESGRKKAASEILKLRDDAKKASDETEHRTNRTLDGLGKIRNEVLGLAVAFTGARGITDFVSSIISGDAATGRLAKNLGVATQQVSAWQYAVKSVGGSADNANASLSRMFGIIEEHKFQGVSSADPILTRLGLRQNDLASPDSALLALSENRTHDTRQERASLLGQLGLDDNTINTLLQGRKAVEALLSTGKRLGATTDADAEAAQRLHARWNEFTTAIAGKARPYIEGLVGNLLDLTKSTDAANVAIPVLVGLLGSAAAAATLAYGPFALLAGVIAGLVVGYKDWQRIRNMTPAQAKEFDDKARSLGARGMAQLRAGDYAGLFQTWKEGALDRLAGDNVSIPGVPGVANPSGGKASGRYEAYFQAQGFSAEQARGIAAGIHAEGGGLGMADNGAFGIGQWRAPRLATMRSMFGLKPNEMPNEKQQLQFLTWELKGGDRGGSKVRGASDADTALLAYIYSFMRPQGAHGEHMIDAVRDVQRGRSYLNGARGHVAGRSVSRTSTSTNETHIGTITVNTHATDAKGIAAALPPALKRRNLTQQANSGVM